MMDFKILNESDRFNNHWLVIRETDNRIVFSDKSVYECCRWVRTWGKSVGLKKKGQPYYKRREVE